VENSLHWVLDVVFGEDDSRPRSGYAVENLAATRRLAINLLRRDSTCKRSLKGKLLRRHGTQLLQTYPQKLICVSPGRCLTYQALRAAAPAALLF